MDFGFLRKKKLKLKYFKNCIFFKQNKNQIIGKQYSL